MKMGWTDDPIADFHRWDAEQQELLKRLPLCYMCCERIQQDTAVMINDHYYCDDCLKELRVTIDIDYE